MDCFDSSRVSKQLCSRRSTGSSRVLIRYSGTQISRLRPNGHYICFLDRPLIIVLMDFQINTNSKLSLLLPNYFSFPLAGIKNSIRIASPITMAQPTRFNHRYGIKSIHQKQIITSCVIMAAIKTDLLLTNLIKKASKNIPRTFPQKIEPIIFQMVVNTLTPDGLECLDEAME